jgi:hypothetical protein
MILAFGASLGTFPGSAKSWEASLRKDSRLRPAPMLNQPNSEKMASDNQPIAPATSIQTAAFNNAYGKLPLAFEANQGQRDPRVKFVSRGSGYTLFLTSSEAVLDFRDAKRGKPPNKDQGKRLALPETHHPSPATESASVLRMRFIGANDHAAVTGEEELASKTNYFIGDDPQKWHTNINNFARVRYRGIYQGVDVVYYGNRELLEFDFIVSPTADPRNIVLEYAGAKINVDARGELVLRTKSGEVRQHKPKVYQEIDGTRRSVEGRYVLTGKNRIGFEVADYDRSHPLVIDPVLSYSTYLGGGNDTFGTSLAVDSSGAAYVTGSTNAIDFPTVNPFQSTTNGQAGFVTKLNPAGTAFVYSTYLGFPNTFPSSIKVDAAGSAFVAGITGSSQFPTTPGAYLRTLQGGQTSFITKLSPDGASLIYSTFLAAVDQLSGIALDSSGNAYVTGATQQTTFPTTAGAFKTTLADGFQNAFVTKLNPAGSALVYSTFVGANVRSLTPPQDRANAIAVDSSGNAYITGQTVSQNFPVTSGAFQTLASSSRDAFVTKLNANGTALIYSTYLGGSNNEVGTGIAVDATGNAYVTGSFEDVDNSDFPVTANAFLPAGLGGFAVRSFLTKVNPTGTALVYSTSLNRRNDSSGAGVAVDSTGSAYVVGGEGTSAAYSVNAVQPVSRGNDAYVLKMNPAGTALTYSTSFGGSSGNTGSAIALDTTGNAYFTGYTTTSDFPVTSGAPQSTKPGGQSATAFVARIGIQTNDCPAIEINPQPLPTAIFGRSYSQQVTATGGAAPYTFSLASSFSNNSLPLGLTLAPDGTISGTPTTTNFAAYFITVQAVDSNGCIGIRTLKLVLAGFEPRFSGLYLKVVARPLIRIGNEYTFFITYANRTTTAATNVPLLLRVPSYVSLRLKFDQPMRTLVFGDDTYFVVSLPRLPPMSDLMELPIIVKVSDPTRSNQQFAVEALIPKYALPAPAIGSTQSPLNLDIGNVQPTGKSGGHVTANGAVNSCYVDPAFGFLCVPDDPYEQKNRENNERYIKSLFPGRPPFGPPVPPVPPGPIFGGNIFSQEFVVPQSPHDPNGKSGSSGVGTERFYTGDVALPYVVTFENVDTASLPAQDVVVTDQLDPNVFDLSTFSFNLVAFGDKQVAPQIGIKQFTTDVDLRPAKQAIVRVNGNFDLSTGLITWRFNTLDPATGMPPQDPQAGFLPPNKTSPEGQGTLLFTIKAKTGLATGTQVKNKARIVFDVNAPIDTPEWVNTIDTAKPTSSVQALPANVSYSFPLSWSGTDVGAGVSTYTIYLSADGGPFMPILTDTTKTSIVVTTLQTNHTLRFYSIARDAAGNEEPAKTSAEAVTTINAPTGNPIDDSTFFVSQHYRDLLNRDPDVSGFNFWVNQITSCGADLQCRDVKRINTSAAFYLSIEFQETGYLVERLYKAAYGDANGTSTFNGVHQLAVPVIRYNEFLSDTQQIGQGVIVLQTGWEAVLEANKQSFISDFVQRSRFTTAYPASMPPAQFVDALNARAGTPLSTAERNQLVNDLATNAKTRAQVLRAVAEDPDLNSAEFNRAFVLMQYFGYLRRNPNDPPDTDQTGYDFWLTKLNQFNGNFVNAEMVKAFLISAEYRQRFGP